MLPELIKLNTDPAVVTSETGYVVAREKEGNFYVCIHGGFRLQVSQTPSVYLLHVEFPEPAAGVFRFITECFGTCDPESTTSKTQKQILFKYKLFWVRHWNENMEGDQKIS